MHILYIYPEFTIKGGADKVILEKANYFVHHGYEVTIVTEAQMGREFSFPVEPAIRHVDMGLDFNRQYSQGLFGRAITYFSLMYKYKHQLEKVLYKLKPDIVIIALGRSIDFITSIKDGSVKIGEAHCIKAHLRSFYLLEKRNFLYRMVARFMRWRTHIHISQLDALVLLTQQDADDWAKIRKKYVIPNAIPSIPETASALKNKQVIMVGRYNDAKGYEYLIPAWRIIHHRHPDWTLHIYGSGEMETLVANWIKEKNLENSMIMHVPTEHIMEKYLESSVCMMSSRYDAFPMVLLEAMVCGVPCVTFDCPYGPRNIIKNEQDGLLVEYLNSQALADGVCRLIEDDKLRMQFGLNARSNIRRFSQDIIMEQWDNLFSHLVKKQK